VIVII
jgi:hypothetical protein